MIQKNDTFSEIINYNKSISSVLERFGIEEKEYHKTVAEVSSDLKIDAEFILEMIRTFDSNQYPNCKKLSQFPVETILDYLRKTHRYYLEKKLPEIELTLQDIIRKFQPSGNTMLFTLGNLFIAYKRKLSDHIKNEEEVLFPYIEFLIQQTKGEIDYPRAKRELSRFSITHFEASHSNIEEDIESTRKTILKYSPEQTFAMSYRIFLNQLELFERDLHRHSIIEDEVLVPKAIRLEELLEAFVERASGFKK